MSKTHWYAPFHGTFDTIATAPDVEPFLCVKFNVAYAPFIRGAIIALLQRQMWNGDKATIDAMLANVNQLLYVFGQQTHCTDGDKHAEEWQDMGTVCEALRYQNGKLQGFCCGEWVDIDGQGTTSQGGTGQPGGGTLQPTPGGGQACYHCNNQAAYQWLLPTTVSTGDTLEFSNFGGAAWDGVAPVPLPGRWDCPNGQFFFLGSCQAGTESLIGIDPLPTAPHMSLVAQINGTWYSCLSTITVPSGVSNAQVVVQLNDNNIGDNQGQYAFDVCVTNNQLVGSCTTLDLRANSGGLTVITTNPGETLGTWVAGQGWTTTQGVNSGGVGRRGVVLQYLPPSGVSITRVTWKIDFTEGIYDTAETAQAMGTDTITWVNHLNGATVSGVDKLLDSGVVSVTPAYVYIRLITDRQSGSVSGFSGAATIKELTVCTEPL